MYFPCKDCASRGYEDCRDCAYEIIDNKFNNAIRALEGILTAGSLDEAQYIAKEIMNGNYFQEEEE